MNLTHPRQTPKQVLKKIPVITTFYKSFVSINGIEFDFVHFCMKRKPIFFKALKEATRQTKRGDKFNCFIITREFNYKDKSLVKEISKVPIAFDELRKRFV